MPISKAIIEALAEGAFIGLLIKIWQSLKKAIQHPAVQGAVAENIPKILKGRELCDENLFSFCFSKANISPEKKIQFAEVINALEAEDRTNGTSYIRNFRFIIALDAIGIGIVTMTKKDGTISVFKRKDFVPSGVSILEEIGTRCNSDQEFRAAVMLTGAMQDAPFGKFDEFLNWLRKMAIPHVLTFLGKHGESLGSTTGNFLFSVSNFINLPFDEALMRSEKLKRISWKENFLKKLALSIRCFWDLF